MHQYQSINQYQHVPLSNSETNNTYGFKFTAPNDVSILHFTPHTVTGTQFFSHRITLQMGSRDRQRSDEHCDTSKKKHGATYGEKPPKQNKPKTSKKSIVILTLIKLGISDA